MQSRIPIYGGRRPLLGIMWVVMLYPASEFSGVAPAMVTVTATPSGSSGMELEHMEQAVDPSRCATNVPQGHCSRGGSGRSRRRVRAADLRKHRFAPPGSNRRPTDYKTRCAKKCAIWPFSGTVREGMTAGPKSLTSTNARWAPSGSNRRLTD
jgi:hypothetical protein